MQRAESSGITKYQIAVWGDAPETVTIDAAGLTQADTVVIDNGHNLVACTGNYSTARLYIEKALVSALHVI